MNSPSSPSSAWQPIATAPEDHTVILLFFPCIGVAMGRRRWPRPYWNPIKKIHTGTWIIYKRPNFYMTPRNPPTHWMPLPPPP